MDELVKALVGLINKGSELATPALYLFFALRAFDTLAVALPITTFIALGYRLIKTRLDTPTDKVWEYLNTGKPVPCYDDHGAYQYTPSANLLRRLGFEKKRVESKAEAREVEA